MRRKGRGVEPMQDRKKQSSMYACIFNHTHTHTHARELPGSSDCKESACSAGGLGSVTGSGRTPGEGNGYPLQYPCLENSMYVCVCVFVCIHSI